MSQEPTLSGDADSSRGDTELLGRTVSGKYKIEKFLGGGAMGAVYKARFAALDKFVALKVMHRTIAADPSFVARFHREAKAASRMDHPNSVRVIDFGEEPDGLLYIAMEYVDGRDLYRVIHEDWPISNADVGDLLMQALAAIAVGHEMGVIHRDLKPENLMILRAKNDEERDAYLVKVCDFGIAKITEKDDEPKKPDDPAGRKLTTEGLVVGTPEYMSPEQAKGEKLDPRSDIYSLGVILYQLLTGRTPFTADTPLAVVLKHITEVPPAPSVHYPGVHKGLEAVCLKALSKDKNERFQTARAMRNAIREALDGRAMPIDVAAATMAMSSPNPQAGTTPMAAASAPMIVAHGMSAAGSVASAPTVAGGMSASHMTPLGTAAATAADLAPPQKSRGGLLVGVIVGAVALGAVGAVAFIKFSAAKNTNASQQLPPPTTPTQPTTNATPPSTPTTNAITPEPSTSTTSPTTPPDSRSAKRVANAPLNGHAPPPTTKATVESPASASAAPVAVAPPTPPPPAPDPPPTAANPPPPTATPPPAPVFNPATCKAAVGAARGNGAANAKDLTMSGTAGAWTACAQSSIREKPGGPISATVHLNFSDNNSFRGASCAGCPPALASCVGSRTRGTVTFKPRGGDITGEIAFDVPVTFTCE
jgi:serine/threonine-protein kinase